ncbi:TetR/AcrR family transcriptional regulator [Kineococcus rubinsiae]|uniref:TetR/AcrR family transcriptional regulator n=1 Tax=Kineococcus rubinsiae TaxID=2609562 RepID=UPI00143155EB|nr:TetR/AcrR family transcriptional regulator [Kineococcus rubinsiae]NIZ92834.1 TetR family transcriptional regulator [Kineococcus rubinsiae]
MVRWEPGAAERLHRAALDLFVEQGFAETTVPQITARAGLTTRTFFRHFADKREVLFAGEDELPAVVARVFAEAAPGLSPLDVVVEGLADVVAPRFDGLHGYLTTRQRIVESDEGLRERELRKLSVLREAALRGFRDRGLAEVEAVLAAHVSVTLFDVSLSRWLEEDAGRTLAAVVRDTGEAFRSVTGSAPATGTA